MSDADAGDRMIPSVTWWKCNAVRKSEAKLPHTDISNDLHSFWCVWHCKAYFNRSPDDSSGNDSIRFCPSTTSRDKWWKLFKLTFSFVFFVGTTLFFFYKHAVYKHARLKLAKKLSTLLSTPQAEILRKNLFFYNFPVLLPSKCRKNNYFSYFFKKMS